MFVDSLGADAFLRRLDAATAALWELLWRRQGGGHRDDDERGLPRLEDPAQFLGEFDATLERAEAQRRVEALARPQVQDLVARFRRGEVALEPFAARLVLHVQTVAKLAAAPETLRGTLREVWARRKVPGYKAQDLARGLSPADCGDEYVDAAWAAAQFRAQRGRCACCDAPMVLVQYAPHCARQATADRLDEEKPHTCTNCVLTHLSCNAAHRPKRHFRATLTRAQVPPLDDDDDEYGARNPFATPRAFAPTGSVSSDDHHHRDDVPAPERAPR